MAAQSRTGFFYSYLIQLLLDCRLVQTTTDLHKTMMPSGKEKETEVVCGRER